MNHVHRPIRAALALAASGALALGGLAATSFAPATVTAAVVAPATAASLSGYPTLQNGSSGGSVTILQHLLIAQGQSITADGSFGPATTSAVKAVQSKKGLGADGVVGPNTWGAIVPSNKSGDTGASVTALQKALNLRGASLTVDGSYGPATTSAVKAAQSRGGISADGVAGPDTWRVLVNNTSGGGGSGTDYADPEGRYANGKLPASTLCSISYAANWKLACYAIKDYEAMNSAYRAAIGSNLTITHGTMTAYRTVADQQYLWDNCPSRCAVPGTSNHGLGKAIDISRSGAGETWLANNASKYGFVRDVSGEPWHFHYIR